MSADAAPLFSAAALDALEVPGVAARWAAVQERLHPCLAALADEVRAALAQQFPRQAPLYQVSFKAQRYVNRGRGMRAPIDEYHVALDRPPRGAGILISVSGAERAVLVGLQLWRARKEPLGLLWGQEGTPGRALWQPLVARIAAEGEARFAERARPGSDQLAPPGVPASPAPSAPSAPLWLDRYLETRNAGYLWAGFRYAWSSLPADLAARLVADVLALFPLNEALMEQVEERTPQGPVLLREVRASYSVQADQPPIEAIIAHIQGQGFALSDTTIRAYHVALQTRPLVILTGISGTGKTRLTRLYADALHDVVPGAANPYYLLVAVQPDWHNARDLLGYYNSIGGSYHPTPLFRFLLRAAAEPQQPHFVCLDELNLARPEYYLAPLLSALETSERLLDIGAPADEVALASGERLRLPLRLPLNLRITGTVNVDESTYPLSDKLLDRANVIELTDVDLPAFRAAYQGAIDETAWQTITRLHAIVARAGQPFGYRTLAEMLRYLEQASGVLAPAQALDLQVKQKVLPRLRGEESPRLRQALTELLGLLLGTGEPGPHRAAQVGAAEVAAAAFPQSAEKVRRMLERLDQEGFTDFYG